MPLSKIKFAPGVNKEGTEYSADAGWFDADKIRFRQGRPEKIGGWVKYSETSFLGVCRSIHDWASLESIRYIGLGTNLKFYVVEGNSFNDVTPIRSTTSAGDVTFAATNGSSTITATDTSHGAVVNDFVTFSSAASLGGNITAAVLNQEYQITAVPTVNTYEFTAKDTSGTTVTANSSDTGNGGSSTVGAYQINTGLNDFWKALDGVLDHTECLLGVVRVAYLLPDNYVCLAKITSEKICSSMLEVEAYSSGMSLVAQEQGL